MATKREKRTDRRNYDVIEDEKTSSKFFKDKEGNQLSEDEIKKTKWKWLCFFISILCIWLMTKFV